MNKNYLKRMQDNGHLPYKNSKGEWCVTYLSTRAEGVCEAMFNTIFKALKFAEKLK